MPKLSIGPYQTGQQDNIEAMWLPNEAYEVVEDMYVWRGRTRKKQGYTLLGRLHTVPGQQVLPILAGFIAGGASTFGAAPFPIADLPLSPGTVTIRIASIAPWPVNIDFVDNGNGTLTCTAATAAPFNLAYGIINYISGRFDLYLDPVTPAGPWAVTVTGYRHVPQTSVMGLGVYEQPNINEEYLIAFDEDHAYLYNVATQIFDPLNDSTGALKVWNGNNANFFWTTNYYRETTTGNYLFWTTNNVANTGVAPAMVMDGIQIYNGVAWFAQTPQIDAAANQIRGCLILIPYRDRMIALNTLEGPIAPAAAIRYSNRARWSQNGIPYSTGLGGADANSWRQDIVGRGGFLDAPTREAIVSAGFFKDTLVVFFERSTWQLRYTHSEIPLPFVWEKIDTDLGSESTFSSIYFDEGLLSVGDKGIVGANSNSVRRIDEKIPDIVFNIHNENDGKMRVQGIRDFYNKMAYWCYPDDDTNGVFPNKILALNYEEKSFSIFNDTFTCFGNWQSYTDYTWATLPYPTWQDWDIPWGSPKTQSFFPNIIAGNQKGFVLVFNQGVTNSIYADLNVSVAIPDSISNGFPAVVQVLNHNLNDGQFIKIYNTRGFVQNALAEAVGTALAGTIFFRGTLANLGIFPASAPVAGGPPYISIQVGANTFADLGNGVLSGGLGGQIDYERGTFNINFGALGADTPVVANYQYNQLNNRVFYIRRSAVNTFELYTIDPVTELPQIVDLTAYAAYQGWGSIAQVSNFKLRTKRFEPFLEDAGAMRMLFFDLLMQKSQMTFSAQILADDAPDQPLDYLYIACFEEAGSTLPKEKVWKRVYSNSVSDFIQLQFLMSNLQMVTETSYASDLVFHNMIIDFDRAGRNINRS